MERPSYYSIIPAEVRYHKRLKANEKLLYGEITALSNKYGYCNASNAYFASEELFDCHKNTISDYIANLKKEGFIDIELIYEEKEVKERRIYLSAKSLIGISQITEEYLSQNTDRGISQITEGNNTSIISKKESSYEEIIKKVFSEKKVILSEELKKTIFEFIKMRKLIKKPLTNKALELMLKKLIKFSEYENIQIEILNQSIENSWQGIFELKQENKKVTDNSSDYQRTQELLKTGYGGR